MNLSTMRIGLVGLAFLGLVAWGPSGEEPATRDAPVRGQEGTAECRDVIIGQGPADWRRDSVIAGPAAVLKGSLNGMVREPGGTMVRKMGMMIVGREPVQVSVPAPLRKRVWLFYGRSAASFAEDPGLKIANFEPCADQQRSVWPGGIRIRGRKPVRLSVTVPGEKTTHILRLGKPRVLGEG